jgi:3D (Asp-Asp-Asp) domain-containing protein
MIWLVVKIAAAALGFIPSIGAVWKMFKKNESLTPVYKTVQLTCYGLADNDPPSADIAFPILHKIASGTGNYEDPITCAADPRQIEKGTIIYIPRFQKYFIMEDSCASAIKQNRKKPPIIDLWIGGTHNSDKQKLNAQEEAYTLDDPETIIIHPTNNMVVNTALLFQD